MDEPIEKITESEMIIWGVFLGGLDCLCAFFLFITAGFGATVTIPTQTFANFWMTRWLKDKGAKQKLGEQIAKYFLGGFLPAGNFGVFIVSAIIHNKLSNAPLLGKYLAK
jgi:hypothetical protein